MLTQVPDRLAVVDALVKTYPNSLYQGTFVKSRNDPQDHFQVVLVIALLPSLEILHP